MKQKYRDKGTTLGYQRQLDKLDQEKSSRTQRRERKRSLEKFTMLMLQHTSKEWWSSFTLEKQELIAAKWNEAQIRWMYHGFEKPNFQNWLIGIKAIHKPDTATYRDKLIDKLLDDN